MSHGQPRRWWVHCSASCGWRGYRTADTAAMAVVKPCPRCGKDAVR